MLCQAVGLMFWVVPECRVFDAAAAVRATLHRRHLVEIPLRRVTTRHLFNVPVGKRTRICDNAIAGRDGASAPNGVSDDRRDDRRHADDPGYNVPWLYSGRRRRLCSGGSLRPAAEQIMCLTLRAELAQVLLLTDPELQIVSLFRRRVAALVLRHVTVPPHQMIRNSSRLACHDQIR